MSETDPPPRFTLAFDGDLLGSLQALGQRLQGVAEQGVYTRVRLSYKGQRLGPDLPLGALVAGELASMALMGPLRAVLATLSVGTVFDVELVWEPSPLVQEGAAHVDAGQLDAAELVLRRALARWPGDPAAHYHLGRALEAADRLEEAEAAYAEAARAEAHPLHGRAVVALRAVGKKIWR